MAVINGSPLDGPVKNTELPVPGLNASLRPVRLMPEFPGEFESWLFSCERVRAALVTANMFGNVKNIRIRMVNIPAFVNRNLPQPTDAEVTVCGVEGVRGIFVAAWFFVIFIGNSL